MLNGLTTILFGYPESNQATSSNSLIEGNEPATNTLGASASPTEGQTSPLEAGLDRENGGHEINSSPDADNTLSSDQLISQHESTTAPLGLDQILVADGHEADVDEDDEDACSTADSWELLEPENEHDVKDSDAGLRAGPEMDRCERTSGILKNSNTAKVASSDEESQRHKSRVWFEKSILVNRESISGDRGVLIEPRSHCPQEMQGNQTPVPAVEAELAAQSDRELEDSSGRPNWSKVVAVSSSESSDVAEMDESWYVTPPPCFTGTKIIDESNERPIQADRENALIEHPSIYIARDVHQKDGKALANRHSLKSVSHTSGSSAGISSPIILKKMTRPTGFIVTKPKRERKVVSNLQRGSSKRDMKTWENKYVVSKWDCEKQGDNNNPGSSFEDAKPIAVSGKALKTKQKRNSSKRKLASVIGDKLSPVLTGDIEASGSSINPTEESDKYKPSLEQTIPQESDPVVFESLTNENSPPKRGDVSDVSPAPMTLAKRAAKIVKPIEPERQPNWQLRRKRSRRQPLASRAPLPPASVSKQNPRPAAADQSVQPMKRVQRGSCSTNSSPSLIDRIGNSIVANLTNLTNGFPPSASMQLQPHATTGDADRFEKSVVKKSHNEPSISIRRQFGRAYLNRQNKCAMLSDRNRRPDRRLKMHLTPNGCSVNRKVHAQFH